MLFPIQSSKIQSYKFSLAAFCGWFIVMMLWLPTSVGGWFVHFELISVGGMWLGSFIISIISALYLARQALEKKQ